MHKTTVWPVYFPTYSDAIAFYFRVNPQANRITAEAAVSRMFRDGEISIGNVRIECVHGRIDGVAY